MAKKVSEPTQSVHAGGGRLVVVSGNDDLAVKSKAKSIVIEICGEDFEVSPCLEVIAGDAEKQKLPAIISDFVVAVKTPPFLSPNKLVWLKNFPFEAALKAEKQKDIEDAIKSLTEILSNPIPEYLKILLSGSGVDRRSTLYKALQKVADMHFIEKIDTNSRDWQTELQGLVYDYCRENGMKISGDAVAYICETVGADGGRVRSEIDKIIAFVYPSNEISLQDCQKIASKTAEASAWAFSNSIMARDLKGALAAIAESCDSNKDSERAMFYSLINCIKMLPCIKSAARILGLSPESNFFTVKSTLEREKGRLGDGSPIAKMNPYRFHILLRDSRNFSDSEIPSIMADVLKANREMVSGSAFSERELLEQIALKICFRGKAL